MKLSITIYEKGHHSGNALGWMWELLGDGETCLDCGTCRTGEEAWEAACLAYDRAEEQRAEADLRDARTADPRDAW